MASHPGLAIVTIMCTQTGPGTQTEVANWAATYDLTNVQVWADTTDYMYTNFCQYPPASGGYPSAIVIDLDTMTIAANVSGGISGAESAIQAILSAEHPCAEY